MSVHTRSAHLLLALALVCGCNQGPGPSGLTAATHAAFPVATGDHALDCATCHTSAETFREITCTGCHTHDQVVTDLVHGAVDGYAYTTASCIGCHPAPTRQAFGHTGITGDCALCHDVGAAFAALPVAGFTHGATHGLDCGGCHQTRNWSAAGAPGVLVRDPARDVTVTGLVPAFVGASITGLTARVQVLPMSMDHAAAALDPATRSDCAACHTLGTGSLYPGELHAALAARGLPQPATCLSCHADAVPAGFVGPTATQPPRSPPSGGMRHEAVAWSGGAPTSTRLVVQDCAVCHASPSGSVQATWATARSGAGVATIHASLGAAGLAQPASCLDCHASSRPTAVLTSTTSALPARVTFDHAQAGPGECATCHAPTTPARWSSWAGGRLHLAGAAAPSSCLPCHAGERPTSSASWVSTTYAASPFDYGTNASNVTHGGGLDCVRCHAGPGTGTWGSTQNWVGGRFEHTGTPADRTCLACHMSQRPDLQPGTTQAAMAQALGFDHAVDGTGDCFGCHQATVRAGRYVDYLNPTTRALPGGDWAGGKFYPGATLVSAPGSAVTLTELTLVRTGTLVTGITTTTATIYGAMSHVSSAIPAAMAPGPDGSPDTSTCWHCHTSTNGTVTSYADGVFHDALSGYAPTPGGAAQPFAQPAGHCSDCHAPMLPTSIVERSASSLVPMDHGARFAAPAVIGGVSASGVEGLDCSTCHQSPGDTWTDGVFHASIGSAVPQDCTVCHYPLMAAPAADVADGTRYVMAHRSPLVTVQRCDACHATALAQSTSTPVAAAQWRTGAYHASVSPQPGRCAACHSPSAPTTPTRSDVVYVLAAGGTATNGSQWMSHAASAAAVDCAVCHAADARPAGAAWSKATPFHANASVPGSCQACHGLANGGGGVVGTNNNLPVGLTDSTTLTTASADASTGVPAGTHDQLVHTDVNVTGHDCGFCHTQAGPSTAAGVQGREWAQARFHASFSVTAPLVMNGTTGRCSSCHLNVKPGPAYAGRDHSAFTAAPGSEDCSSCHTWPGTGTISAPNWRGAGAPALITVGGFTIPNPPANPSVTQAGIPGLPHPSATAATCATCHVGGVGGKGALGYDHASTLIATHCNACHEAGSDLVVTRWNGSTTRGSGAGDTRPITLASVPARYKGNTKTETTPNHFYLDRAGGQVDCGRCHVTPTGVSTATTGTTFLTAWAFSHPPEEPILDFCWQCHPNGPPD